MKRILLTVLAITLCLTIFSGCSSNQYKGPLSCISRFGNDGTEIALMDMTEDAHKTILSILNKGKWQDGVTNCGYDFEFTTKNETIRYHSECGTFIDITNNRSLSLSGKDRLSINTILGVIDNSENEEYDISLAFPAQNKTFQVDDEPPTFYWTKNKGFPKSYIIEIDYMNDGTYMSRTVDVGITYLLSKEDWNTIKSNAPIVDGKQKIQWRIRIDYMADSNKEPYYTGWTYFWINQAFE